MNLKTRINLLLTYAALLAGVSACEFDKNGNLVVPPEPETFTLDGTKWISPDIRDGRDPLTFAQARYPISGSERLLLRFESLGEHEHDISLASGRKVYVDIAVTDDQNLTTAQQTLELCPVTKNWMMLATWRSAYPMPGGRWGNEGADYDSSNCLFPVGQAPITIRFDVTQWVVDYVRGRGQNFGVVLLARNGGRVLIRGDRDGTYSPRINWLRQP
jgi:hypothetical protein